MIVHMGIASLTKFDKFALEKSEADSLSASIANVTDQFDWTPDPKFTAIAGLVTTAGMIYGPRLYLYNEWSKEQAKKKARSNVEGFPQVFNPSFATDFNNGKI